ncbi:alginate export family protein [Catalinimonas niigatensis]|uniref:alginate export family protein n=1 Tax=Catalinimonas niigatensis TaxID=1397264 RepID=UPI0026651978|nr:alginate export family protein [Catalinimonas niigatensis]WPP52867.1 alginate export family protein [Catalinimonas niigatensis]
MNRTFTKGIILLLLLSWSVIQFAQAQFTVSGEIRPRTEFRDGFKTINTEAHAPAFFIEQRSRIYLDYQQDKVGFHLSLQDVRIWGNASQIYKSDPALTNIYEAWGEYHFNVKSSLRVGRQALDYDNARFLGDLDWAQQGRSHDAVRYIYKDSSGFTFHAAAAYNQNVPFEPSKLSSTFYEGVDNYKTMQYFWLHKDWASAQASLLIFNDGRQRSDSTLAFRQTYGFIGDKSLGAVKLGGELYYQGGKDPAGKKVSAWLAAINATMNTSITPLTIGVDYLSGTNPTDDMNHAFNPLYGTNHKFYGFMDYFYVGNNHGQNGQTAGLLDFYVQSKFKLGQKSALITHFHHFHSPTTIYAAEGTGEKLASILGEEIDLVYNLNLTPEVNFKLGYSQLFSTQSLEAVKGGADRKGLNQWAWAMITIKPTFYSK